MPDTSARKMELKKKLRMQIQRLRDSNSVEKADARDLLKRRGMTRPERRLVAARCQAEAHSMLLDETSVRQDVSQSQFIRTMNELLTLSK